RSRGNWCRRTRRPASEPAPALRAGAGSHQFDARHGGVVARPRPELEDTEVAARAVGVTRRDLGEELVGDVLVVDARDHLAALVHATVLRLGDEPLGI